MVLAGNLLYLRILGYPDALIPYKERLMKLNLLPVSYWHEISVLVFFFKVINGIYNIDITEFVQPKVIIRSTRHSCSLDYQPLKCRTSLFQRSYFNRTVKLWNSLSSSIRTLPSVNAFKAALVKHYKKALIETFDQDNVYTWKSLCRIRNIDEIENKDDINGLILRLEYLNRLIVKPKERFCDSILSSLGRVLFILKRMEEEFEYEDNNETRSPST